MTSLIVAICCLVLLQSPMGFAQQPTWSVETTADAITAKPLVTARSQARPARNSPYTYELTLACSDSHMTVRLTTFQADATGAAAIPRPIRFQGWVVTPTEEDRVLRSVLNVRFSVDGKSLQTGLFESDGSNQAVWRKPRDIRGIRESVAADFYSELRDLPTGRLVIEDVFPGESVEFAFLALTHDQRSALRTACFPIEFAPSVSVDGSTSAPTNVTPPSQPGETGVVLPRLLRQVKPEYTTDAMKASIEGVLLVDAVVLPDGTIGEVKVTKSLDDGLDQQAINAVKQWRFTPGLRNGKPVPVLVTIEMSFWLRERPR